jgi:DNA-binding NarL/FixJ family response regulator
VLLVDDHRIVRDGLKGVIETVDDISIIGEASDGMDAVEQATTLRPQVVVMDLSMPRLNGIEATRRIKAQLPEVQVVGLSMHEGDDSADAMKAAGACEFLAKGGPVEDLITAISNAATVK